MKTMTELSSVELKEIKGGIKFGIEISVSGVLDGVKRNTKFKFKPFIKF